MKDLRSMIRPNIASLKPYSSARHEFSGAASIYLDANESPFDSGLNRYPDPLQSELRLKLAERFGVSGDQIFMGNGSDEAIDLLFRAFCRPKEDHVILLPPTYGMYSVCAQINDTPIIEVPLDEHFKIDKAGIQEALSTHTVKLIFACSPNNPTGNSLDPDEIRWLAGFENTLLVLDQAYADFADQAPDVRSLLNETGNLVVLRTFSKAWGLAGIRLGMAFADRELISILNTIKPPYNINSLTQRAALQAIEAMDRIESENAIIIEERARVAKALSTLDCAQHVYPSDANFLLVKFNKSSYVFDLLRSNGIIVRDRSSAIPDTLRITVGTPDENSKLLALLNTIS